MEEMIALTNVCDRSRTFMMKKINYILATIIILCHTLFRSPDNDNKYVPKSQRLKHYAWLTHEIQHNAKKEVEYKKGSPMITDPLMNLEANKYKIRLRHNKWNAKSESETKILSLESKLMSLQKKDSMMVPPPS